jgi:asparagine synthase (glutamine-hydrolysing)
MCGITGLFSRVPVENHDYSIQHALKRLRHRGPDDFGIWGDRHIQLGHTRLAILDLSPLGHQPMSYQDERFWITFNGEIYNYLELRQELSELGYGFKSRSDTEVLLAAFAEWGEDCLARLRGMFAFGIWDGRLNRLFLARDRTGEKPLYYWANETTFYFASELKTLLSLLPIVPELDPVAIDLYMHYQYVPEPRTPLKGVMKLAAAHYLWVDLAEWQMEPQRYWSLDQAKPVAGNVTELLRHELEQTLSFTLRSDVPVGIALSGGLDSGGIAALAAPQYKDVLQAFSVGYPGRPPCDERDQARALAHQLSLPFHEVELRTEDLVEGFPTLVALMDDPIADIAAYGHFAVMRLAADHGVKVMLSGIGGDELFWGYDWVIRAAGLAQKKQVALRHRKGLETSWMVSDQWTGRPFYHRLCSSQKIPARLQSVLRHLQDVSQMALNYPEQSVFYNVRNDFQVAWACHSHLYTSGFLEQIPQRNPFEPFVGFLEDGANIPQQVCQWLFDTWLVSNCLALGDRTAMAASLEVRLPLLDHRLIELVVGLQKQYPDSPVIHKRWLKNALADVLPDEILNRRKQGFEPPYEVWIEALIQRYGEMVRNGYLVQLGFFKRGYVRQLFEDFRNHYSIVYKLITLEFWYRSVIVSKT